jgi:hypothetical protein
MWSTWFQSAMMSFRVLAHVDAQTKRWWQIMSLRPHDVDCWWKAMMQPIDEAAT